MERLGSFNLQLASYDATQVSTPAGRDRLGDHFIKLIKKQHLPAEMLKRVRVEVVNVHIVQSDRDFVFCDMISSRVLSSRENL